MPWVEVTEQEDILGTAYGVFHCLILDVLPLKEGNTVVCKNRWATVFDSGFSLRQCPAVDTVESMAWYLPRSFSQLWQFVTQIFWTWLMSVYLLAPTRFCFKYCASNSLDLIELLTCIENAVFIWCPLVIILEERMKSLSISACFRIPV